MTGQKQNSRKSFEGERKTLLVCTIILLTFSLLVAIATQGSLTYYTLPHALVGLISVGVLLRFSAVPIVFTRILTILAVLGALSAIGLTIAYLPYYSQYLNYINSIK